MNSKGQNAPEIILEGIIAIIIAYVGLQIFQVLFPGIIGILLGIFLFALAIIMIILKLKS